MDTRQAMAVLKEAGAKRNKELVGLARAGATVAALVVQFGITRQRVTRILERARARGELDDGK